MTTTSNPVQALQQRAGATTVPAGWPSYAGFRYLPERERWAMYGGAKAYREALELQGFQMDEPYDAFVRRVCTELDL